MATEGIVFITLAILSCLTGIFLILWGLLGKNKSRPTRTNADRIRAMTDEELAKKMSGLESFALTCGGGWSPEKWLEWLKKEVDG